jgi:hypothetical protein
MQSGAEPNSFAGDDTPSDGGVSGRLWTFAPDEFTVNCSMAALLSERFGTMWATGSRRSYDQHQVAGNFDTAGSGRAASSPRRSSVSRRAHRLRRQLAADGVLVRSSAS